MKIRNRTINWCISWIAVKITKLLYATCRVREITTTPNTNPFEDTGESRYVVSFWHDLLLMYVFSRQPLKMAGLVSRHQDGGYLADAMSILKIKPIRGSSKKGGSLAMRQCLETAKDYHIAITPDGPRGPRHEMKDGAIFLAAQTGLPILPTAAVCRRYWRPRGNWTDMLVPQPFTQIMIWAEDPIEVPAEITREQIPIYINRVERSMAVAAERAQLALDHPEKIPEILSSDQSEVRSQAA